MNRQELETEIMRLRKWLADTGLSKTIDETNANEQKLRELQEQHRNLPLEEVHMGTLSFRPKIEYECGNEVIKKDQFGRFFNPNDSFASGLHTEFLVNEYGEPYLMKKSVCNSDTKGETKIYIYDIVIDHSVEPLPRKQEIVTPCAKAEELKTMGTIKSDAYFEKLGLVKDKQTHTWRKPTPKEFCDRLSQKKLEEKKKQVEQEKKKKGKWGFRRI